jgi:PPOX class probable F420-dependent enzyme
MAIGDEKYLRTTTYRKSGDPVSTPTWIVDLDGGRVGFLTSSKSGKYKRLRNSQHITLQPSDPRGKVKAGTTPAAGTATLASSGPDFDAIQTKIRAKYGSMVPVSRFFQALRHIGKSFPHADVAVVVTLDQG